MTTASQAALRHVWTMRKSGANVRRMLVFAKIAPEKKQIVFEET
jgi:hypothetical protein